jgi:hypothetical protein
MASEVTGKGRVPFGILECHICSFGIRASDTARSRQACKSFGGLERAEAGQAGLVFQVEDGTTYEYDNGSLSPD